MSAESNRLEIGWRETLAIQGVRSLALARGASKLAIAILSYASMIYVAREGSSQFLVSVVGSAGYLAAFLFGLQGGKIADSLSKRSAILLGYVLQASICIAIPVLFDVDARHIAAVIFLSSAVMQIVTPALKASVSLVANEEQLAYASTVIALLGSLGSTLGSALIGPILIQKTSIETVLYVSAGVFVLGIFRALVLPKEIHGKSISETLDGFEWRPKALSLRYSAEWIWNHRPIATMILVGAIVVATFEAFNTLMPVYVRDVLNADPVQSIYIFAPAGIGFMIGTLLTPRMIRVRGARWTAVAAMLLMTTSATLYGFIDQVDGFLSLFSPFRLLMAFTDIELSDAILAAGVIGIPANLGSTAAGSAVQQYLNAKVPVEEQGGVFGFQEVEENLLTLVSVMALGVVATFAGSKAVFVVAPAIVAIAVIGLLRYAARVAGNTQLTRNEAFHLLTNTEVDGHHSSDHEHSP